MSMAETEAPPSGKAGLIATMAALTAIAAIGGGIVGKLAATRLAAAPPAASTAAVPKGAAAAAPAANYPTDTEVRELPAIVTNLADPKSVHIRLQVAIAFSKKSVPNPPVLAAQVSEDIVAFLKTLSLREIQGASGLQNLREDLNERAVTRSQGAIHEVIIETLVTQ